MLSAHVVAAPPVPDAAAGVPPFRELFAANAPYVWRVLRRLGVGEADVADVAQEVFVVVHRNLPSFEGRSSLRTWIYGICIRTASDWRRRAHVRREVATSQPPEEVVDATQDAAVDLGKARALLDRLLGDLDDDKRAVFVLFEIEQVPMEEVARAVGCPLQTAYSRLHAARELITAAARRHRGEKR